MGKKSKEQHDNVKLTDEDPQRLVKDRPKAKKAAKSDQAGDLAELKAQLLRVRADFENFKRRTQEERAGLFDTARAELALNLLPVIDNLERAAKHVPDEVSKTEWYQGFTGIKQQFDKVLEDMGIARVASVGEKFDPNRHEAVSHEPSNDYDKDVVAEEFEAGYALGDSVIRPAKVKVSSGSAAEADSNNKSAEKEK